MARRRTKTTTPTAAEQQAALDHMRAMFARWTERGDIICVFENHDLGHYDMGRRVAIPFAPELAIQFNVTGHLPTGVSMATQAPDNATIGLGWRYLLVARCSTVDDAMAVMDEGAMERTTEQEEAVARRMVELIEQARQARHLEEGGADGERPAST